MKTLEDYLCLHFSHYYPLKYLKLLAHFGSIKNLLNANPAELQHAGLNNSVIAAIKAPDNKKIEQALQWAEKPNHHIVTLGSDHYPRLLKEIPDPPLLLYIYGNPALLAKMNIAVVGSRHPTPMGADTAFNFAAELARAGLVITSGLALGIDGASHRGALAVAGETIAVLGSGLQEIYPQKHRALALEIAERGAIISEFPLDTSPAKPNFPLRNRLISGLSVGTLVVEATLQSGSLITAKLAMDQNREVFAIPGSIHNPQSRGCHQLIKDGVQLIEEVSEILHNVGHFSEVSGSLSIKSLNSPSKMTRELDPESQMLLDCVGFDRVCVDQLVALTGLEVAKVSTILVGLQISGHVTSAMGGYIRVK